MHILIVTNLRGYNRQGYDLASCLRKAGHAVRLVQLAPQSDPKKGEFGVGFIKPHGRLSKFHVLLNMWHLFAKTIFCRKDVVVCIGAQNLLIGAFYKIVCRSRVIYYSLEYGGYKAFERILIRRFVDKYMDVEAHRQVRAYEDLSLNIPFFIIHNLPVRIDSFPRGGALRRYLADKYSATGDERLVIYAGSYQSYACIETIVEASKQFPQKTWLILMVAEAAAHGIANDSANCKVIPPQYGAGFFDWLVDADCALLPYESDDDFNVQNCSPQKLFDCYLAGVPYLASARPIILETLAEFADAGRTCDFRSIPSILAGVGHVLPLSSEVTREKMRALYRSKFNYDCYAKEIEQFVCK